MILAICKLESCAHTGADCADVGHTAKLQTRLLPVSHESRGVIQSSKKVDY